MLLPASVKADHGQPNVIIGARHPGPRAGGPPQDSRTERGLFKKRTTGECFHIQPIFCGYMSIRTLSHRLTQMNTDLSEKNGSAEKWIQPPLRLLQVCAHLCSSLAFTAV